jgi:hypothetical protein
MTNQASEDELDTVLKQHREWMRGIRTDHLIGTNHAETKSAIQAIICTEKLKLLAEVRERVVGENEPTGTTAAQVYRNDLRVEQRAALGKLEAEL